MSDDYIPVLDAAKALKMSPARFARLLTKERERLPVELNYELVSQLENYHAQRGCSLKINVNGLENLYTDNFGMIAYFPILMIHRLDWEEFLSNRSKNKEVMTPLYRELEEAQARITELETELAACREQLEEARREISGKKEHETAHGEEFPAEYEGHGLCSLVIRMRKEGKTEKEIAATLHDSGKWCSASQIGALLHPGGNISADGLLKHAQRLLGKA